MIASFDLSFAAVDVIARGLGVDCRAFPFAIPSVGREVAERVRVVEAVRDDLHRRGLAQDGDLVPEVEDAVRLLGEHDTAIAVVGVGAAGALKARAATKGRRSALAVQARESLRFTLVRPTEVILAVVGLLPMLAAGPGRSLSITRPVDPVPGADSAVRAAVRPARTAVDAQVHGAEEILRRPRVGDGYFVVTRGAEQAGGLSWIDTDRGRYLVWASPDKTHITYSPADPTRLAVKLAELGKSLAGT